MLTYPLSKESGRSLYEQLYEGIRRDILSGTLPAHQRLPSKRALAQHLEVSIITVQNAYEQLAAEGYIYSQEKRGYYVSPVERPLQAAARQPAPLPPEPEQKTYFLDLVTNSIDRAYFPFTVWARLMRETLLERDKALLQAAPYNGAEELRRAISDYLRQFRGMNVDSGQIIVGAGTEFLYSLLIQLLGREKCYAVEDPGYSKIAEIYRSHQVNLRQVEELVNDAILEGYPVVTEILPIEEAKKKGAVAMFGEKYGETVRVVEMSDFSVEFCGGTHVDNTAKAGPFRIKSESSVASGVRRIEATCGKLSLKAMESSQGVLSRAAQFLKTAPSGLLERMEQQANEMKQLRQALEKFKAEASLGEARQFLASAKTVKDLHVLATTRSGVDTAELRTMGDFLRDKDPKAVAVIASINGEKITFLAVCGKEAVARGIKAGDLVRHVSAICGGKGGGKPDSAMGGGSDPLKVDDALASVDDFVSEKLG